MKEELKYIFVHGAGGWGQYDPIDRVLPYWGMFTGSLMNFLNRRGFEAYAASVDPLADIHVRACELYAQLAGKRVDYGKAYSEAHQTQRYGKDYTGKALIPDLNENTRLVLLGHSMGGGTVRLFARYMESGNEKEKAVSDENDLSDLFKGGKGKNIFSVVTIASPHNGSTSLDLISDPDFDVSKIKVPLYSKVTMKILGMRINTGRRSRPETRSSNIDFTLAKNREIGLLPKAYYFSIACSSSKEQEDGTHAPLKNKTEILYLERSIQIGQYEGVTPEGYQIGKEWRENDGLVNTVSARYPLSDVWKPFDKDYIEKGIWNVLPDYKGDHMSLQGGFFIRNDIRWFYLNLLGMIERLYGSE